MDEGTVVLMEIPCAEKKPVQFAGGEYTRIGTNKKNIKEYPDKKKLWWIFDSIPYISYIIKKSKKGIDSEAKEW